jgi:hypothetical protein
LTVVPLPLVSLLVNRDCFVLARAPSAVASALTDLVREATVAIEFRVELGAGFPQIQGQPFISGFSLGSLSEIISDLRPLASLHQSGILMNNLKTPIDIETAFDSYQLTEQLGEGGAGRVYGGVASTGSPVAVKVLTSESKDKRRRFKNEIAFLSRNQHAHIVTVTDHGVAAAGSVRGPFYVMERYTGSLRDELNSKLSSDRVIPQFSQIIDGVEAAHFQEVTHRDLKPENVLIRNPGNIAAIADFGVASFTADQLLTLVKTAPTTRLANFQYAAPEQRVADALWG